MKPQILSLRKQEEMSLMPGKRQEFQRWAPEAWCQNCKCNSPVLAGGTNNVIFHPLLHTRNKQVPKGSLEGGVAFPSGLQHFVSLSRTMDIIYTLFLEVYHKEVSPQTSFRLSPRLQPQPRSIYRSWEPFSAASDNPPEDTGTPSGIRAGRSHLRLTLTSSEPRGACISDGSVPHVFS